VLRGQQRDAERVREPPRDDSVDQPGVGVNHIERPTRGETTAERPQRGVVRIRDVTGSTPLAVEKDRQPRDRHSRNAPAGRPVERGGTRDGGTQHRSGRRPPLGTGVADPADVRRFERGDHQIRPRSRECAHEVGHERPAAGLVVRRIPAGYDEDAQTASVRGGHARSMGSGSVRLGNGNGVMPSTRP
jgi:hypothetical protein